MSERVSALADRAADWVDRVLDWAAEERDPLRSFGKGMLIVYVICASIVVPIVLLVWLVTVLA